MGGNLCLNIHNFSNVVANFANDARDKNSGTVVWHEAKDNLRRDDNH